MGYVAQALGAKNKNEHGIDWCAPLTGWVGSLNKLDIQINEGIEKMNGKKKHHPKNSHGYPT